MRACLRTVARSRETSPGNHSNRFNVQHEAVLRYGVASNKPSRFGVGFAYVFIWFLKMMIIIPMNLYGVEDDDHNPYDVIWLL